MSVYDPEKYRAYYQENKVAIALKRKLRRQKRNVSGKLKKERARRRAWWANMPPEQKERELQKRRDYAKMIKESNPEKIRNKDRQTYQKQKERQLKRYATQLKYERANPGRAKKNYEKNKARILAQQKTHKSKKACNPENI